MILSDSRNWRTATLLLGASIEQAILLLNEVGLRIVLIIDVENKLIGTISDGDIRRGLLKNLGLKDPIDSIVNIHPQVVTNDLARETVINLMVRNKIQQIPIVDEQYKLLGLHMWDELSTPVKRPNSMIIMAGGRGTRLYPLTSNVPKPMLPIRGKPILEHIIERAKNEGFIHFILAIHHLGHIVETYFGDGSNLGVNIEYLREDYPLGTAGALTLLDPLPSAPIIVTNGDVITDVHYGQLLDYHIQNDAIATMAVGLQEWQNSFGVVEIVGNEIVNYKEKPISQNFINAGVYVLEPKVINFLPRFTSSDMPTMFEIAIQNKMKVIAYPIHESWTDIGRPDDLIAAGYDNTIGLSE
jgi:dTDP-glucose pyrophosphorylase